MTLFHIQVTQTHTFLCSSQLLYPVETSSSISLDKAREEADRKLRKLGDKNDK